MIEAGARMIAIVARENDDGTMEMIYVFDRDGKMVDFRSRSFRSGRSTRWPTCTRER
jgi:hypothetical protein